MLTRFIQACCATSGDGLYEGLEWVRFYAYRSSAPTSSAVGRLRNVHVVSLNVVSASEGVKNHVFFPGLAWK